MCGIQGRSSYGEMPFIALESNKDKKLNTSSLPKLIKHFPQRLNERHYHEKCIWIDSQSFSWRWVLFERWEISKVEPTNRADFLFSLREKYRVTGYAVNNIQPAKWREQKTSPLMRMLFFRCRYLSYFSKLFHNLRYYKSIPVDTFLIRLVQWNK